MARGSEKKGTRVAVEGDQDCRDFLLLTLLMGQKNPGELPLKEEGHEAGELTHVLERGKEQEGKPVLYGEDMFMLHVPFSHTRRSCVLPVWS